MRKKTIAQCIILAFACGTTTLSLAANVPSNLTLAKKQKVVIGNGTEVATIDPAKASGVPEGNVIDQLMEGLTNQDGNGNIVPGVAKSWETKDNEVYTFHLRPDAKWSNGDLVTAKDFVYGWERSVDPVTASPYAWYVAFSKIKNAQAIIDGKKDKSTLGVKALDDHTLEVTLSEPIPYFTKMTNNMIFMPIHKATVEKYGEKWTKPEHFIGNGAYKLARWVVNERMELVRNPNYWDNKHTVIDHATYLPIENPIAEMNRYLSHEVDITSGVPNEQFHRLQKEYPDDLSIHGSLCTYYYQFNAKKKPFDDVRVRKAMSYAVDRDIIANAILGQGQKPAYFLTPEITANFTPVFPPYAKMSQKERNNEAIRLLKEAGYDKDHPLSFSILYNTSENHKKLAIAISSMWKKTLGVKTKLENKEWKTYLESQREGDFQVVRAGWCADYNEPSSFLGLMTTAYKGGGAQWGNKDYDALINKALKETSPDKRSQDYLDAEKMLADEMPIIPIYQYVTTQLVNPQVGGFPAGNAQNKVYVKDLYIKAKK